MNLILSLLAGAAVLQADLPGPGNYYVMSNDGGTTWRVEASGYVSDRCHLTVRVPRTTAGHRIFVGRFEPGN